MKNSLAARVGRILTGSVRSFIEKLEAAAPESVMLEALSEVDGALDEIRGQLGKKESEKHIIGSKLEATKKELTDLIEQINTALDINKEDLAQAGVSRQLDLEVQVPILEKSLADCVAEIKELEEYIDAIQAKKRSMREELRVLKEASKKENGETPQSKEFQAKLEKAEEIFENASRTPLTNTGISLNEATKLQSLAELSRKNRINERLERIKADRKKD